MVRNTESKQMPESPSEEEKSAKEADAMKNVPIWFKGPEAIAKSIENPVDRYKALQKGESYSKHLAENMASEEDWKKSKEGQEWATAIEAVKKDDEVKKYIADEQKKNQEELKRINEELQRKKAEREAGINRTRGKIENAFVRAGGQELQGAIAQAKAKREEQGTHIYSAEEMKQNIEKSRKKAS